MLDLDLLFKNHFTDKNISDNNFFKFVEIHNARLTGGNGSGVFNQIIAETTAVLNQFAAAISDEDVKFANQQGLTITVNKLLRDFKKFAARSEKLVLATLGKESDAFQEFFPNGMAEYWQCSLKNVELLMDRFVEAADRHIAELGTDLKNKAQTLYTDFNNARKAQLGKKGEVAESKVVTRDKRRALELQVMKNLFFIGYTYPGNVIRCREFFDQSFLRRKKRKQVTD